MTYFTSWLYYEWKKWWLQQQLNKTINHLYGCYCNGELAMYEMRYQVMSEREFTLRELARVEGWWAAICRGIVHKAAKQGKPEICKEFTNKMVDAHCKRDTYLAQANALKGEHNGR